MVFSIFFRFTLCSVVSISIILLDCVPGLTQSRLQEHRFPTQGNPRIIISNADAVTIVAWEQNVVSVAANVSGQSLPVDEVKIKPEKNKIEISCEPSKPERKISLTLRTPSKAIVDLKTQGHRIEVKEPVGRIEVIASRESIQIAVPESASLDMTDAPNALEHRQMSAGFSRIGIGKRRTGFGPPYVKVTAVTAMVIASRGTIAPLTPTAQPIRNPTFAATTIARRNSSMSRALNRSNPQLIRNRPQQPPPATETAEGSLKLETHLVNLNVSATDKAGKAVPDLKPEDFSVYEDGVKQQISFFSSEKSPFNLVLLIDLSGSMKDEIDLIKATALHFLDVISPQDSVAVITFTTDVTVVSHLTKDREDLKESIEWMLAPAGGTSFYDALGYTLVEEFRKVKQQRNAVIAITDGEDNSLQSNFLTKLRPNIRGMVAGSFLTFDELLDGATESEALIYAIHLNPMHAQPTLVTNASGLRAQSPVLQIQNEMTVIATKQLHSLADASGARFYHASRIEDLRGVFEQVAAELRAVYSMAYTPTNLNYDGRFRKISVKANRPDVTVRTRPGYYGR
jgi:VWFA-related protein